MQYHPQAHKPIHNYGNTDSRQIVINYTFYKASGQFAGYDVRSPVLRAYHTQEECFIKLVKDQS